MKPRLPKAERKALRFAYDLICGTASSYFAYTHGLVLHSLAGKWILRHAGWIEPDRDPTRLFLNEAVFTRLLMAGYFECDYSAPSGLWLYRLSREGCRAMGWEWPSVNPENKRRPLTPIERHKQRDAFQMTRNTHRRPYMLSHNNRSAHVVPQYRLYHRLHK
jgi:hypothetical protein